VAPHLPRLLCRRIHVKQIFENLLGNAMKYIGRQADPHVEIGWLQDERGVQIFVRDNGIGMETSMLERIFLPFFRVGSEEVDGSGIGLCIVKTVVDQYKGAVTVQSSPGVGSTFYVSLPVATRSPEAASCARDGARDEAETDQIGGRRGMLVGSKERFI
jgi:signal transduction histidine kinase